MVRCPQRGQSVPEPGFWLVLPFHPAWSSSGLSQLDSSLAQSFCWKSFSTSQLPNPKFGTIWISWKCEGKRVLPLSGPRHGTGWCGVGWLVVGWGAVACLLFPMYSHLRYIPKFYSFSCSKLVDVERCSVIKKRLQRALVFQRPCGGRRSFTVIAQRKQRKPWVLLLHLWKCTTNYALAFASASFPQDQYYRIRSRKYIAESWYGLVSQNDMTEVYYGVMIQICGTEQYCGITEQHHITVL